MSPRVVSIVLLVVGLGGCRPAAIEEDLQQPTAKGQQTDQGRGSPQEPSGDDDGAVGRNAAVYLRSSVPTLTIEVDAVAGKEPSGQALDHLRSVLDAVADKPGGISVRPAEQIEGRDGRYSRADLAAIERTNRGTNSSGETASLYILSLDGEFADDPNALGVAYRAGSMALFSDSIEEAAAPLSDPGALERAVVVHELGHLLRLVNIGYESPRKREDPDHPHHSTNEGSVMHWAIETGAVTRILEGPPPDDFDEADRRDLADIKAGRL